MRSSGKTTITVAVVLFLVLALVATSSSAIGWGGWGGDGEPEPLNILLTNDDGWDAPGITAMKAALEAAGHNVVVVAPSENYSGIGMARNVDFGSFITYSVEGDGVYAIDATPADCVMVGLLHVMPDADLVISGSNFGQNLGPMVNSSGTVGAAVRAAAGFGVPSLAVSVQMLNEEYQAGFPSTAEAFPQAGEFTADLVEKLQSTELGNALLPEYIALNVNIPVPYEDIQGVKVTSLGRVPDADIFTQDFIPGELVGSPVDIQLPFPYAGKLFVYGGSPDEEEPVRNADTTAVTEGYISITPVNGDWTAFSQLLPIKVRTLGLQP